MRKVPRTAGMNQKEFEEFIDNLNNTGFDLNPELISSKYDNILGEFSDEIDEVLYYLLFHYDIYSKILDLKNNFIPGPVYYHGIEIKKSNLLEYKEELEKKIEEEYAFIDKKLYSLKTVVGIIS